MARYFDVNPDNPQPRALDQIVAILRAGGVIAYPTDSGYALGCVMGNRSGLDRIRELRDLDTKHNFTLVCSEFAQLGQYVQMSNDVFRAFKAATPGGYTFILKATKEVPRRLMNEKKKTIGIRVPTNNIAQALLTELGEPLMSSTLILPGQVLAEADPEEFRGQLEKVVDLIIDGGTQGAQPTTVIDFSDDEPKVVRFGAGDPTPFE